MNTVTEPFARTKTDWQPVHEPVHFYSDGLRLSGQFTRGRGAAPGERRPTIVCLHGYTGRKEVYMPGYIRELSGAGYHTLDFHHRGFGESEGVPRRNKPWDQVADVMSAMIYIRQRDDVDVDRIGLYGTSFGGSVAMMSAAHDEGIRCVVSVGSSAHCGRSSHDKRTYSQRLDWEDLMKIDRVERVMTGQSRRVPYDVLVPSGRAEADSIDTMYKVNERYPDGFPMENYDHAYTFVPEDYVDRISPRPCMFIHAERDTIVALPEARSFYAHAREPKQLVIIPGANHVDVYEPRNPQVFQVVIGHMLGFFADSLGVPAVA